MNKIKLMYDLVKSMKEKEVLNGTLKVEGSKDQIGFLDLEGDMQRLATGEIAAGMKTALDWNGKKINHQSSVQFDPQSISLGKHAYLHHPHIHYHGQGENCKKPRHGLRMLAFAFKLLDSMQIEENDDKTLLVSATGDGIFEELQEIMKAHLEHKTTHPHHKFPQLAELLASPQTRTKLTIKINARKDVEKMVLAAEGQLKDEGGSHEMRLQGQLSLNWQPTA